MFKFRKIAAVLTGAVMLSSTVALAAAANYPAPFVSGGAANVAIVYGSGQAAQGGTDLVAAMNINTDLTAKLAAQTTSSGSPSSVSGGDSYKLEKSSTKFHLGDYAGNVVSTSVTDSNLPVLLADGVFEDNDNDEFDYTQKVTLNNATIQPTMFEDNDFAAKAPTVGIKFANGANVLNYTLDFTDQPEWADLVTSDIPILGKSYYVLSNSTAVGHSLTLLDAASTVVVAEGESQSVVVGDKTYNVGISFIGSDSVKLDVNGQVTNSLNEGETQKLSGGAYVGVKDILYSSKDTGVSKVEVSIGKGKLLLTNASDVELNEESISGVTATFVNSTTKLDTITLSWNVDEDMFAAGNSSVLMPGFEAIKLSFGGLSYPKEEKIVVDQDGSDSLLLDDFPLKDSTESINLVFFNGTNYTIAGKDSDNKLVATYGSSLTFDGDTDDWFAASWNDSKDSESYLMRAIDWKNESGTQKVTLQQRKNGAWADVKTDAQSGDSVTVGNVELTVTSPVRSTKTVTIAAGNSATTFNKLYSKEGLRVLLPAINTTTVNITTNVLGTSCAGSNITAALPTLVPGQLGYSITVINNSDATGITCAKLPSTYNLLLSEEDKDDTLAAGNTINVTFGSTSDGDVKITGLSMGANSGSSTEQGDTKVFRNFAYSALATEALWDQSGDNDAPVTLTYHGSEVTADVYLASPSTVIGGGSGGSLGTVTLLDSETSSFSGKNLIVVGGNCVNSVAAQLLGTSSAQCGADFETATGVKAGEALIKTFASPFSASNVATLVAGRLADDTTKAATYLTTQTVDTTVGTGLKVSSATQAVPLVTSA